MLGAKQGRALAGKKMSEADKPMLYINKNQVHLYPKH